MAQPYTRLIWSFFPSRYAILDQVRCQNDLVVPVGSSSIRMEASVAEEDENMHLPFHHPCQRAEWSSSSNLCRAGADKPSPFSSAQGRPLQAIPRPSGEPRSHSFGVCYLARACHAHPQHHVLDELGCAWLPQCWTWHQQAPGGASNSDKARHLARKGTAGAGAHRRRSPTSSLHFINPGDERDQPAQSGCSSVTSPGGLPQEA